MVDRKIKHALLHQILIAHADEEYNTHAVVFIIFIHCTFQS